MQLKPRPQRVRPQPVLTVSPLGQIFEGDSVTLRCEVTGASAGWRYYWYRSGQSRAGLDDVWYNGRWVYLQPLSDSSSGAGGTFTISAVTGTHRGLYWCRAGRGDAPYYTQYSEDVTLTVSALPHASLTVEPHWSPIYTGETVSLRCGLSGGYTDWQYHWYKDGKRIEDAQPAGHTVTGDKLSITAVSVSDGGKYHCEGQRADRPLSSQRRVRPQPVLTVSPLGQIFEGDSVTLRCEVTGASAGWRYYWYRTGQSRAGLDYVRYNGRRVYLQPLSDSSSGAGGTFTISAVTGTHRGLYWCRAERGDTPYYTQYSGAVTLTVSGE
ncbi:Fc receptor-like protein 2 [Amia ocellicauda]|uniref:Fc receptor-like protein 2 n=1 Tax=Amia ocellicauda TaxID=2972642 RepID=UPI003463EEE1